MEKQRATQLLRAQVDEIPEVRTAGRRSSKFTGWIRHTSVTIEKIFGKGHDNVRDFEDISYSFGVYSSRTTEASLVQRFEQGLENAQAVLESMIQEIDTFWEQSTGQPRAAKASADRVDLVVVCALHRPELEKLLAIGDAEWAHEPASAEDPHTYHRTTWQTDAGNSLNVLAAAPNHMGLTASAVLASKIIWRYRPRLVAMAGIAAGVRASNQSYGDILAAEHTFDYGAGKVTSDGGTTEFQPDPRPIAINTRLLARLKEWERERRGLDQIERSWPAKKPGTRLQLHVGPLASGAAVIDDRAPVDEILRHWRKLIGIEMEAYGVHSACRDCVEPAPLFLCLKSICDFAHEKKDDWQDYAAFTSARLCHLFVCAEWERLFPE